MLEEELVRLLIDKNYHISFAESCTAGLATATIANVSGSSSVLDASIITYANEAKIHYLNVKKDTIDTYGVVSENVAYEMAKGIAEVNHADIGVGITGIAGPTGGTPYKPVGMVCFGISINNDVTTYTKHFGNIGRQEVRQASVKYILEKLINLLKS